MREKMRSIAIFALGAIVLFTATSCDKENKDYLPDLPPLETMVMDFSDFSSRPVGTKSTTASYENFVYSYLTVAYWNTVAGLITVVPVTAYTHALSQTAEYLGDNTWEWNFDVTVNNITYVATLTAARLNNEEFSAEMVIALAALPNEEVKWFDGVVRYDHTKADWTIYKEGTTAVLDIAWNKDFVTLEADLTYTLVEADQAETGSYIMWDYNPGEVFDAAYTISGSAGMCNIEWNATTIEGHVKSPVYFEDDNWHCWESKANGLADMDCE